MSHRQNVTPSDELAKRKTKIVDMERELAAERERVRKEEEEEEHACEAAEARWWAGPSAAGSRKPVSRGVAAA